MKRGKKWYRSKTVWAGIIAIAFAVFKAMNDGLGLEAAAFGSFGAAEILLRGLTDEKIIW